MRKALADWGVNAVSVERTPVFATEEAAALEPLLQAVVEPGDRALARIALASPLLGLDYARIEADIQGETAWAAWLDTLLALREDWQRRGFMAMFQSLLQRLGGTGGPGAGADGLTERRLTNLLHLGELLQEASKTQAGMDALLSWYAARRAEAAGGEDAGDEQQLRLESDAELVQIVTVHGAKGLEYPVVFLPDLWSCRPRDAKGLVTFHRGTELTLDAGSDEREAHLLLAERERLAEDLRLVYVALTRARAALYLVWGRAGSQRRPRRRVGPRLAAAPAPERRRPARPGPRTPSPGSPTCNRTWMPWPLPPAGPSAVLPIPQPDEVIPGPSGGRPADPGGAPPDPARPPRLAYRQLLGAGPQRPPGPHPATGPGGRGPGAALPRRQRRRLLPAPAAGADRLPRRGRAPGPGAQRPDRHPFRAGPRQLRAGRRDLAGACHPHPPGRRRALPGATRPAAAPQRTGVRLRHRPGRYRRPQPQPFRSSGLTPPAPAWTPRAFRPGHRRHRPGL